MEEKIKSGDWIYLKSNPKIRVKVTILNPNHIIDFRSQRKEPPYFAHEDDVTKITDKNIIEELEIEYNKTIQE